MSQLRLHLDRCREMTRLVATKTIYVSRTVYEMMDREKRADARTSSRSSDTGLALDKSSVSHKSGPLSFPLRCCCFP
jgi:hypothetical protein